MQILLVGIVLALASAIVVAAVRAARRGAATAREAQRHAEERAEHEARVAAEQEVQRQAAEVRRRAEQDIAGEREAQRQAAETHRRAEQDARVAAEQEAQRQAAEARHRAEQDARIAGEREAQCQAAEAHRRAEQDARIAAEGDAKNGSGLEEDEARTPIDLGDVPAALGDPTGAALATSADQVSAVLGKPATVLRAPRQYRPTARVPAGPRTVATTTGEREIRERAMPVEVRLVFEKAGFCRVSLLPRRAAGMPVEFSVTGSGNPPDLLALQDEWYQDVILPDIARLLEEGIEWAGTLPDGRSARLSLSGRDLYVLARHSELNGFVSTPRLVLGEEHVVLCVAWRLPEVRAAIALTESPEPTALTSDNGVPTGWVGLRGVLPRRPTAPSPFGDVLDALRPLAEVEIALMGGIRIDRQTWLSGFPPTIRLRGDTSSINTIEIDGHVATSAADGYVAPGWDSPGEHSVWCSSSTRTFAIRSGAEEWESWDAYVWSLGEISDADTATQSRAAICGVLVRPPRASGSGSRATVVPASNPVLIGTRPGEIEFCTPRRDVRAGLCVGFPLFEPVWAIPADALHSDKRTARVLLIGPPRPVAEGEREGEPRSTRAGGRAPRDLAMGLRAHPWCMAILAASRKGLRTDPARAEIVTLWRDYKRCAKTLRKASR